MVLAVQSQSVPLSTPSVTKTPNIAPIVSADKVADIAGLMDKIIDIKEARTQEAASLKGRLNVKEAILIGGDLFSMGYLAFQGLLLIRPALAAIPAISLASLICGEVGGAINIAVAFICLQEGIQAFKNGDKALATRLITNFVIFLAIGLIMILSSLATKVAALGAISAFFAANPWLLPVLFFIASIPIIIEVCNRIKNIWTKQDLGAQLPTLNWHQLMGIVKKDDDKNNPPYHLRHLFDISDEKAISKSLRRKFEKFQADMGVKAALETFKLMKLVLESKRNEEIENQRILALKEVAKWNRAQYVRLFQRILYTGAFGVSMVGLNPSMGSSILNAIQNFAMSLANAIPLYMDTFWPFKRNTPRVVAKVSKDDILKLVSQ